MLASDLANPEFTGAIANPDALLHVQFYWYEPIDKWESEKAGRQVKMTKREPVLVDGKPNGTYRDTGEPLRLPYVRFMRPGDQLSIMEVPVEESHKRRWPQQWMAWQMQEGMLDGDINIPGWRLDEWTDLDPDQLRELKYKRFSTVEQVAGASDAQVQGLGMGGLALREKAKAALRARMGAEVRGEIEKRDSEIAELKEQMKNITAMVQGSGKPAAVLAVETMALNIPPANDERAALAEQYKAKFGRDPHPKMKVETLKEKLAA